MTEIAKTKKWVTSGTFLTFEEADIKRIELKNKHESVKIKRGKKGGEVFRVKVWDPPPPPKNKKSNRKSKNNVDKKVRSRQE
jgi:hypothetical protein